MGENHGGGITLQGLFDDFAGIDGGVVDRTPEQLIKSQYAVTVIQEQAAKYFVWTVSQPCYKKIPAVGRGTYQVTWYQLLLQEPAAALFD